jgi:hypothetical protein
MLWGQTSLLRGPVFVLFCLGLGNVAFRRMSRSAGLTPSEMLLIYSMVAVSGCIGGFGMLQFLINILPSELHYANSINHYERFAHYIAPYLTPHNPAVIEDFFRGSSTMYRSDVLADWAVPILVWSLFLFAMCWVTLCLSVIVRRQWVEGERLSFPLTYLPIEMARGASGESPFWKSRAMWVGFAVAGIVESIDYINYFYPSMPYLQIKPYHLEQLFTVPPYNNMGMLVTAFYPFVIGIAFLLSTEVSFSCWFFYLLTKVEFIVCNMLGVGGAGSAGRHGVAHPPFLGEQAIGAFAAFALFLLYRSRKSMLAAVKSAWTDKGIADASDPEAPLSPKAAVWGGLVGIAALSIFAWVIGLPLWISIAFWVLYFLLLVVVTRIVAEAGAGWVNGPSVSVHSSLIASFGSNAVGPQGLTTFGYLGWFDSEYRDTPMPHQLTAMKLAHEVHTPRKQLLWGLIIAVVVGLIASWWTYLHIYYEYGAATAKVRPALQGVGIQSMKNIDNALNMVIQPDPGALGAYAVGAAIMLALAVCRQQVVWFPFHPVGYALAGTMSMEYLWCPFFVGWIIKAVLLRYGGITAYKKALPFFLGLIMGDYIVPTVWGIWGTIAHTQVYMSFPH